MKDFLTNFKDVIVSFFGFCQDTFLNKETLKTIYDFGCENVLLSAIIVVMIVVAAYFFARIARELLLILLALWIGVASITAYFEPHEPKVNLFIFLGIIFAGIASFVSIVRLKRLF